jgi:hypothetical protein
MATDTIRSEQKRAIMRRVYYVFALRLATHPHALRLCALAVLGYLLGRLVHVAVVAQSFKAVPVGQVGDFLIATVRHADWPTLFVLGLTIMTLLSFRLRFPRLALPYLRHG